MCCNIFHRVCFLSGNFSTITVTFSFQRRIGYYLIQVYFPDMFVVALSWIVFWMDKDDMGNRMALGITTILTIMFLLGSLNGTLPKVSYPKALDWYLLMSFAFVFLSLVECMIVFCLNLSAAQDKKQIKCKVCCFKLRHTGLHRLLSVQTCTHKKTRLVCSVRSFVLSFYSRNLIQFSPRNECNFQGRSFITSSYFP